MKLKTLKDIEKWYIPHHQRKLKRTYQVSVKQLREEAIKWVKEENKKWEDVLKGKDLLASFPNSPSSRLFIEFHNITEEDLK